MAFNFTNYAGIAPQASPLQDLIGKALGGYTDMTKAKYLPREKEAEIFHKQISPLAMLASSPYFSAMQPQQQQQIAAYISSMLGKQGFGMGGQGSMGMGQQSGMSNQGQGNASPNQGGASQYNYGNNAEPQMQGTEGYDQNGEGLIPQNPGEHFTGKFKQTPYTPGTAHRGEQGETVYAPTGANVQKGIDVLTESKGLKKLFDAYSAVAPKVAGGGLIKRELSRYASGIAKTGLPLTGKISEALGGSTLSNEAASAESYIAQMAPAMRAIGFSNPEIQEMLKPHPGETEKNIKERLKNTWPVIERKIKQHQKNLKQGININQGAQNAANEISGDYEIPQAKGAEMLLTAPDGTQGFVPAEKALELIKSGKFKEAQ